MASAIRSFSLVAGRVTARSTRKCGFQRSLNVVARTAPALRTSVPASRRNIVASGIFDGIKKPHEYPRPGGGKWGDKDEDFQVSFMDNPEIKKESKFPVPPFADSLGVMFQNKWTNPAENPELPYTLDRSEGVTVMKIKEGKYAGQEVVLAHMAFTLEWCVPSPPPLHTFEEAPIVKERPSGDSIH